MLKIDGIKLRLGEGEELLRLRAASCDVVGFGRIAIRKSIDIPSWEARNWPLEYENMGVRVSADVKVLQ